MNNPVTGFLVTFKNRFIAAVTSQLTQGASADGLAKTCGAAVAFGVFPLLGFTTLLCLVFGAIFKLNQPILQTVNYLMMPIQLIAIPVFGYGGSYFFVSEPLDLSPAHLATEFSVSASAFFTEYGWVGFRAVVLWAIVAPILGYLVYQISFPAFRRMELRRSESKGREERERQAK